MDGTSSATRKTKERRPTPIPARLRRRLERKLLSLGGSEVIWQACDPDAALISDRGQRFSQRVRMRRGEPHRCHANAAESWAGATDKYQVVTGYALGGDRWVSHSWVIDGNNLYETTHRFDRYFGVVLPRLRALKFWFENVLIRDYPGGDARREFWESRPGVLARVREMGRLPGDEFVRRMEAGSPGGCARRSPRNEQT